MSDTQENSTDKQVDQNWDGKGITWDVPTPYGYPHAIDAVGSVAAPLLAGFSITLAGIVVTSEGSFHWPNVALLFLVVAAVCLLATVQFGFWARQYTVTPSDLASWWPDIADEWRYNELRREQWSYRAAFTFWATRTRRAYRLGILSLLLGLATVLVPAGNLGDLDPIRLAALVVVLTGFVGELAWMASVWILHARAEQSKLLRVARWLARRISPEVPNVQPPGAE